MSTRAVRVPAAVRRVIVEHALGERPRECCGLLVGNGRVVRYAAPMPNIDASPVRYRIDDRAHIALGRVLRGLRPPVEIVGVYHSHPDGDPVPSPTDVAEAYYPEWIHIIVGLRRARPVLRAYRIARGRARLVTLA